MASSTDESDNHPATSSFVSEETFEVEGVVDERVECGQKVYRIRWKGFGPDGDTWEPEDNLSEGCAALLEEYARSKNQSAQPPNVQAESNFGADASVLDMLMSGAKGEKKMKSRSSRASSVSTIGSAHREGEEKDVDMSPSEAISSTTGQSSKSRKAAGGGRTSKEDHPKKSEPASSDNPTKSDSGEPESSNVVSSDGPQQALEPQHVESSVVATDEGQQEHESASNLQQEMLKDVSEQSKTTNIDEKPKKKRGRPRKNPVPALDEVAEQEKSRAQPKGKKKSKAKVAEEVKDDAAAIEMMDDDEASMSSRTAHDKSSEPDGPSSTADSTEHQRQQRKRRRRTELDNLYVADRVPDWTEEVLKEGIVGAEETAAGKRVTRQVVKRVKPTKTSSSTAILRTRSATRPRNSRSRSPSSTYENIDRTSRPDSGDEYESLQQEATVVADSSTPTNSVTLLSAAPDTSTKSSSENSHLPPDSKQSTCSNTPLSVSADQKPPAPPNLTHDEKRDKTPAIGEQQQMQPPTAPRRRRPVSDEKLPLPISFGLDLNQEFKRKMKIFQLDKGQPVRQSAFVRACMEGDVAVVRNAVLALKSKQQSFELDVNAVDHSGLTLLMRLCTVTCSSAHQHEDVMEYLAQAGADVNYSHPDTGQFALHLAVSANAVCKVKKLISLKAAVNVADRGGVTPLMLAAQSNRQHIVFALLEFGADYNAESSTDRRRGERRTALKVAEEAGHASSASVLLNHSRRVKEQFDAARSKVLIDMRIKREISPLHVYGLWEASEFRVFFNFEVTKLPNFRYGFVVVLAVAQFTGQQVHVRLWGPSPFNTVLMNEEPLRCLQDDGRFVFLTKLKTGTNCLRIKLDKQARDSQMRMLVQVFLVQLNQPALPPAPSIPLEAADKI